MAKKNSKVKTVETIIFKPPRIISIYSEQPPKTCSENCVDFLKLSLGILFFFLIFVICALDARMKIENNDILGLLLLM